MKFPKHWQQCKPFVRSLRRREYIEQNKKGKIELYMSAGIYLYMYELWMDGQAFGERRVKKAFVRVMKARKI